MWCAAYVVPAPPRLMTRGTWSEETRGENNLLPYLSDIAVTVLHMNHTLLCRLKLFFSQGDNTIEINGTSRVHAHASNQLSISTRKILKKRTVFARVQ